MVRKINNIAVELAIPAARAVDLLQPMFIVESANRT